MAVTVPGRGRSVAPAGQQKSTCDRDLKFKRPVCSRHGPGPDESESQTRINLNRATDSEPELAAPKNASARLSAGGPT